jgi:hypothetical protein
MFRGNIIASLQRSTTHQLPQEEVLWTADPRALQYIFHTSGYKFSKRTVANEITRLFTGKSILITDCRSCHYRHMRYVANMFQPSIIKGIERS